MDTEHPSEFVKTDGFEKTIAFGLQHMKTIWKMMQEHKSFRMVLEYNAEAVNTDITYFFTGDDAQDNHRED